MGSTKRSKKVVKKKVTKKVVKKSVYANRDEARAAIAKGTY